MLKEFNKRWLRPSLSLLCSLLIIGGLYSLNRYIDSQAYDKPRSYVVKVYQNESLLSGSAIVIAPGLVLTAAHLAIEENLYIQGLPAKVLKNNQEYDVALLEANVSCPCAPLGISPEIGDRVIAIGYPLGQMQYVTIGTIQGWKDNRIWTDTLLAPGSSGGGLFSFQQGKWRLVGVTVQVSGMSVGFNRLPVLHMTQSTDILQVKEFIGFKLPEASLF